MKRSRCLSIGATAMMVFALSFLGCRNPLETTDWSDLAKGKTATSGAASVQGDLIAGQTIKVGTVTVTNDADSVYVTYSLTGGWVMTESHLAVALSLAGIPQTKSHNPIPGQFNNKASHDPPATEYLYTLKLSALGYTKGDLYLAAHAEVQKVDATGAVLQEESAWAAGMQFTGKNWATHFTFTPVFGYSVVYEGNGATGGSVPIDPGKYLQGDTVTVLGSGSLVKDGHTFTGWNTQADGSGSTYIEGQTFPMGNTDVTLFACWATAALDLTGYWDMYMTIVGVPGEMGPELFGILQTGSELDCSKGLTGIINGSAITWKIQYGTDVLEMTGTVSENELTASFTNMPPWGTGTFRFVRSTLDFGRIDLEGTCQGASVVVHKDYGFATRSETMAHHTNRFSVNTGSFIGSLEFISLEPYPGASFQVTNDWPQELGLIQVYFHFMDGHTEQATAGNVMFGRYDTTGMGGAFFDLEFLSGSLTGDFNLFCGTTLERSVWVHTDIDLQYRDCDHQLNIWVQVPGEMVLGHSFTQEGTLRWIDEDDPAASGQDSGTMEITLSRFDEDGIIGTIEASFMGGSGVSGSFSLPFVVTGMQPPGQ